MIAPGVKSPFVAIACGGTGGHLFPGVVIAEQLQRRNCAVMLLISPKDIDQQAVKSARGMQIVTLPAVALQNRNYISFARSFWQSWRASRKIFKDHPPQAVLAMGGFTSAPPILAAKKFHAKTFLHESNTIPGRANRFLARFVDEAFVGFPEAAARLRVLKVTTTGTPVRSQFRPRDPAACRIKLGFESDRPVILVMGGSQGASGINEIILSTLPALGERAKNWQWLHLTGVNDSEKVKSAYDAHGLSAIVKPFLMEMDLALGAATVAISRAGASSLAEIAIMRLPSLLIPYPTAANNHQFHNARAFEKTGAARLLEQKAVTPEKVAVLLRELVEDADARSKIQTSLAQWHTPRSAEQIADCILNALGGRFSLATQRGERAVAKDTMNPTLERPMNTGTQNADELAGRVSRATVIRRGEPLAKHTTLRVGGPADIYVEPASEDDLAGVVKFCGKRDLPFFVMGRGSNLLVRDGGFRGVIICLAHPYFSRIEVAGERLRCGAGAKLKDVALEAKRHGLSNAEFFEGIPGSVGGALRMNAGAMGNATFDIIESVRLMDFSGNVRELAPKEMPVEYRGCGILKANIALGAVFRCAPAPREKIEERMKAFSQKRWKSQPAAPSAGCIFKNPAAIPAGKLIDELGLKGTRVGGAMVSTEHGNFIVNDGKATARDILQLIAILKRRAKEERDIELSTEVEIIGEN